VRTGGLTVSVGNSRPGQRRELAMRARLILLHDEDPMRAPFGKVSHGRAGGAGRHGTTTYHMPPYVPGGRVAGAGTANRMANCPVTAPIRQIRQGQQQPGSESR
jgi:hypothetical protein